MSPLLADPPTNEVGPASRLAASDTPETSRGLRPGSTLPRPTIEMVIAASLILWLVTGFLLMALEIW